MATSEHVPAWKRLGLKLKFAKDTVNSESPQSQHVSLSNGESKPQQKHEKKRCSIESQDAAPAAKRVKSSYSNESVLQHHQSPHESYAPEQTANDRLARSVYGGRTLTGTTKTPQKIVFNDDANDKVISDDGHSTLTRKKSVTFTPETKAEDGASGQIFSKLWLASTSTEPAEDATIEAPTPTRDPEATFKAKPQAKPKSKDKKIKQKSDQSDTEQRSACVAYLDQFHNDKANWKFNKSRQNDIIKHIWNPESIPPSSNNALIAYISGLQGIGPRQRILEGAVAILHPLVEKHKDDIGEIKMDTPETQRATYEKAFRQQLRILESTQRSEADDETLKVMRLETEQAERAEAVLREALWQELRPGVASPDKDNGKMFANEDAAGSVVSTNSNGTATKRKSRKSRTATSSSSESSSSEDDSDSDSDSDSSSD